MKNITRNRKGFAGILAMSMIFIMLMSFNSTALYNMFLTFCALTKTQFAVAENTYRARFVIDRGIWLINNEYAPQPYDGSYSDDTFSIRTFDTPVTGTLIIECITRGTRHSDSVYDITAKVGQMTLKMQYQNNKRKEFVSGSG